MKTLKFGNGTWATKKGSTLAYNDEGGNFKPLPFTYTGAGKGTRVNKEGLIEVVENDRPRIDYTDSEDGVFLLEKAATNLITYSEDFSHSSWVKNGTLITPNTTIAPDGSLTADTVTFSGSNQYLLKAVNYTSTVGSKATISLFTKTEIQILLFGGATPNGTDVYSFKSYANGWYRQELTRTFSVATTATIQYILFDLAIGGYIIWGAQLEINSNYSSSYIPTQGTIQTRVQETASGSGNSEVFNDSQGIIFADIQGLNEVYRLGISENASTSNRVLIGQSSSFLSYIVTSGSTPVVNNNVSGYGLNQKLKIAAKYKQNDFALWVNGFEVVTVSSGNTPTNLNSLDFKGQGANAYIKTKELAYYDEVLTDLELETLTSYRSWEAMVKELNLNIIHNE